MTTLVHFEVDEETKARKDERLKRLLELSLKSLGQLPQLEKPTAEQKRWANRKVKAPSRTWRSYT